MAPEREKKKKKEKLPENRFVTPGGTYFPSTFRNTHKQ